MFISYVCLSVNQSLFQNLQSLVGRFPLNQGSRDSILTKITLMATVGANVCVGGGEGGAKFWPNGKRCRSHMHCIGSPTVPLDMTMNGLEGPI